MKNTTAKHPNGKPSMIFKSCSWICNQIVAYDNDSWSGRVPRSSAGRNQGFEKITTIFLKS